jgi:hypothetical protein
MLVRDWERLSSSSSMLLSNWFLVSSSMLLSNQFFVGVILTGVPPAAAQNVAQLSTQQSAKKKVKKKF